MAMNQSQEKLRHFVNGSSSGKNKKNEEKRCKRDRRCCHAVFMWIYFHWFVYSVQSQFVAYKSPKTIPSKIPHKKQNKIRTHQNKWPIQKEVDQEMPLTAKVKRSTVRFMHIHMNCVCLPFDINRWKYILFCMRSTVWENWRAKYRWRHIHRFEENKFRLILWSTLLTTQHQHQQQEHSSILRAYRICKQHCPHNSPLSLSRYPLHRCMHARTRWKCDIFLEQENALCLGYAVCLLLSFLCNFFLFFLSNCDEYYFLIYVQCALQLLLLSFEWMFEWANEIYPYFPIENWTFCNKVKIYDLAFTVCDSYTIEFIVISFACSLAYTTNTFASVERLPRWHSMAAAMSNSKLALFFF